MTHHSCLFRYQMIFWLFVVIHVLGWTLAPALARHNLPMDSIEGFVWSQKLVFGYDKAPLLNAWITALAVKLFGYVDWGIYFTSQVAVAGCFIALWQLAKKMLPIPYALLSMMILEGFQYYNIGAIDFDDNVLQLPLWALSCLFFYKALLENKITHWVWLGIFAGLAMLAKYYAVLLLLSMFALLLRKDNHQYWREKGLYCAGIVFVFILFPHVMWLFQNNFLTIHYVFGRIGDLPTWQSHIINPLLFLRDEAYALIIPYLLLSLLFFKSAASQGSLANGVEKFSLPSLNLFQQQFLIYLGFGPFILATVLSLLMGIKLHIMWGSALFSLAGIFLMGFFPPQLDKQKMDRFFVAIVLLFLLAQVGYMLSLHRSQDTSSAHFPGQKIAKALTNDWHARYQQPLAYVIGSRWLAGNIAFYSSDHPIVLIDADVKLAPWIDFFDVYQKGVLSVWEISQYGTVFPQEYEYIIAKSQFGIVKIFPWQFAEVAKPVKIGVLFFPPQKSSMRNVSNDHT